MVGARAVEKRGALGRLTVAGMAQAVARIAGMIGPGLDVCLAAARRVDDADFGEADRRAVAFDLVQETDPRPLLGDRRASDFARFR